MISLQQNVLLSDFSNFKIGGEASYFARVESEEVILELLKKWKEVSSNFLPKQQRIFVLGGGTNLLISDEGFEGLVILNAIKFIKREKNVLEVGAGVLFTDLIDYCIENSLSGFEWAGGLPGTIGGAVRGNAGAFGGETKDNVAEVKSVNLNTYGAKIRNNKDCIFGYRTSVFKKGSGEVEIIVSVKFNLSEGVRENIEKDTQKGIDYRRARHPLEFPNTGSIFKNTPLADVPDKTREEFREFVKNDPFPVLPSAKLISRAGLIDRRIGDAVVSPKHPNFIVNVGRASAKDVRALINIVKQEVLDKYGVSLEEEVISI